MKQNLYSSQLDRNQTLIEKNLKDIINNNPKKANVE